MVHVMSYSFCFQYIIVAIHVIDMNIEEWANKSAGQRLPVVRLAISAEYAAESLLDMANAVCCEQQYKTCRQLLTLR
jgi:hypothetical protein